MGEAWEILQQTQVDIVVSDIKMPQMNGVELVRAISNNRRFVARLAEVRIEYETNLLAGTVQYFEARGGKTTEFRQ